MTPLEGQTFAGYEILAKLGQGGMGAVYKARQQMLNRLVALKVMAPSLSGDPSFVARFIREASAAANLNHPNMVQVYTAGENDKIYYIAMEFVEGESLRIRLDRLGRIPPQEAIAITVYVAQALQYAWNKARLIHRDIKPDNVFLSNAGEVKVGDLGLAKSVGGETTELTQTGTAMGSPHYISPEQATGLKDVDFRTDIYSLGCTLYHMLTGQTPYTGDSSMIVMMKHVNDPPPAIFKTWPTCPMPLGMLVGKMLSKDRNARPQSYEQLVDDLMAVHEKLKNLESVRAVAVTPAAPQPKSVTPAVQATVAARPSAKPRSSKAIYATAGAAAVVAIAGLMLWSPWKTREEESGKGQAAKPVSAAVSSAVPAPSAGEAVKMPALPVETAATPPKSSALLAETGAAREAEPTPPKFSTLFDGRDTSAWQHGDSSPCKWRVEDGALVAGATDLDTREKFQDFELHIEFACPQDRKQGNSGVYIQGRYELQILESFGKPATDTSCGSIYKLKAPEQNASKPPDEWQTFDITFHAGRFDAAGSKTANARVSVVHNGTTIQRDVEIPRSSGKGEEESAAPGPIRLQAYGSPVRFRNIRISPLVPATVATPKKTRRVLVFCRCDGFVHRDGIAAANKAIEEMGKKSGAFETDISSDYEALDAAKLAGYDAVVLNNTTKLKIPDDAKKQALLDFVRGGKGLVGIHAATDNFNEDPPLAKLIGGIFDGHPWGANGTWAIKLDEPAHPLCRAFEGRGFKLRDEIYQLKEPYVRADRRVLLSLDLSDPVTANVRGMKREDKDFAIAWIKNEGKGRVFYCGLGHGPNVFEEPAVLQFYLDGIRWALGDLEADATPIGAAAVSATPAAMQNAINLLLLVDPQKDAVKGQWTLTDEGVRLEKPELAGVLDLPYAPPEEYDFEIEFTPQSDGRNVNQFLVAAGRSFAWKLNLYGQQPPIHGLDLLDGKLAKNRDEAVAQKPLTLEPGQRYTSKVEVRRGSLRALVNGEEFMRWSGDFNRLSLEPIFKLHDDRHLGVGSVTRGVVFHHIEVREVTGKGTFTRGAPAVQSGSANLPPNVFLYYDFDQAEPNGTVKDKNGHGNDGKIVGARWTPAGRRGGAYEFGADRNYISVPKSASFHPAKLTVSAWIRTSRIDAVWRRIIDKQWDRGFAMSIGGLDRQSSRFQGKATLEINSHFFASDAPVADGQWHHVVGTFDGEQQKLYVDGRLQNGRANWHGEVAANPFDITIGANRSNPDAKLGEVGASFEGMLDEVMIFDRALSAEEIKSLFDSAGTAPAANLENRPDIAALRYGLYFHFDITTFTGYQDMSRVGKAPPSLFAPRALDVRQWVRVAREAGATFAVLTAKHEAGFCMWPAKNYDYHVGLCPVRTDIVGEFVAACKAEGIKPGVHYAVPDGHIEGQVKFRGPVEPAHFAIIKKHLTELTANYPDILIYILDCAHRLSPEQFREVSNLLKQSNPQRLILQTALNERRGRIPSIPGLQEHNAVSVNKNWFWSPNAELTPASSLYQDYLKSAEQKQPLLVNVGPDRDGRIPDEYVAVLTALKGMMGVSTGAAPSPSATSGSAPGQRLQWFGYSVCDKPSAIQEIAPYTNFILLRDWEKNTNADEMIGAARKAGLKVILKLPSKQTWAEMENTVRPFIAKHRDTIVAACWGVTYHFSDWTPETLAENSRRLKQACPQLQCWAEFVEEPKSKVDTLPIPPEVDVILVNFYFDTQPASLRRKANNTFAGWMSKANGRPVLLQWIGQNVPKTTPDTMRTCAEVVREFGCAGLCFHSYDDSISANGGRKSGIVSNPTLVNEIKAIAKESGFAK